MTTENANVPWRFDVARCTKPVKKEECKSGKSKEQEHAEVSEDEQRAVAHSVIQECVGGRGRTNRSLEETLTSVAMARTSPASARERREELRPERQYSCALKIEMKSMIDDGWRMWKGRRRKSGRAKHQTLKLGWDESLGTTVTLHTRHSLLHQWNLTFVPIESLEPHLTVVTAIVSKSVMLQFSMLCHQSLY